MAQFFCDTFNRIESMMLDSSMLIAFTLNRWQAKAEQEEVKKRELAELKDKAEQLRLSGELPFYEKEKHGLGTKVKNALTCHHGS